jgi:hypothetical protein
MQDYSQYQNSTHTMYVKNTITVSLSILAFFGIGMGTALYYHEQNTQQMQACVKAGKEWTVIKPDEHSSNTERVCLDKKLDTK